MSQYIIKNIYHSGTKGSRGVERTDGRYPLRKGRMVEFDPKDIVIGEPARLIYLTDENKEPYPESTKEDLYFHLPIIHLPMLWTSNVVSITNLTPEEIILETLNSIFILQLVGNKQDEVIH